MNTAPKHLSERGESLRSIRGIAQRAFARAAGAPLVAGNAVRLLIDAEQNYAAWHAAIAAAQRAIYFENYIFKPDVVGKRFRDALIARAEAGVKVRVLIDWIGSVRTSRKFWEPLLKLGGHVRYHNPPRLDSPLGWLSRDHRKTLTVDGTIGFVSGICVSNTWLGDAARGIEPWRDTGIELRGPAVADLVPAFTQVWAENGTPICNDELATLTPAAPAGEIHVRVIATSPNLAGIYRLDLLIAAMAERRLWLTDAYFAALPAYVQALRAAARDGVDVRLLVPGGSDLPWLRPLTTAGYRPLLEAGVRVFEWNGSMLHAKTAVADGRWARVGSTNLNIASWMSNYELDVAIEDNDFAAEMEATYKRDLAHSTEVVLKKLRPQRLHSPDESRSRPGGGSFARVTAGAIRLGRTVGAAITNHRVLGATEAFPLFGIALIPIALAALGILYPRIVAWTAASFFSLLSLMLLLRSWRLYRAGRNVER